MGFLWDLVQQNQITKQRDRATTDGERINNLELEVDRLSTLVHELISRLETHLGTDLNQDGRIG